MTTSPHDLGTIDATDDARQVVLVVDDDKDVRNLVCRYLEDAGYETLSAMNGDDALRIWRASIRPIRLLVCDVAMPGMTGPQLAEAVDAIQPGIGVLFITGSEPPPIPAEHGVRWDCLSKPFKQMALARKARALVAASAAAGS
jgi:CheY-like chemotaxis protein